MVKKIVYHLILLSTIALIASYAHAGGGYGGHGMSRSSPSSYHGGEGSGGKNPSYSYPSVGYKGYGGKSPGYNTSSNGLKNYGGKSQQMTKGEKDLTSNVRTIEYGQGTPIEECQKFFEESFAQRREFAAKRDYYFEKRQDPETSPEDIQRQRTEIRELFRAVEERNINNCRWVY